MTEDWREWLTDDGPGYWVDDDGRVVWEVSNEVS